MNECKESSLEWPQVLVCARSYLNLDVKFPEGIPASILEKMREALVVARCEALIEKDQSGYQSSSEAALMGSLEP